MKENNIRVFEESPANFKRVKVSEELKDLLTVMLHDVPGKRPTLKKLLTSKWLVRILKDFENPATM